MIHLPLLLVLLILAVIVSVIIDRRMRARDIAQASTAEGSSSASAVQSQVSWFARLMGRSNQTVTAQQFSAWSKQAFADQPLLQSWLDALPETALSALLVELERFCYNLGIDLQWLMAQPLPAPPAKAPTKNDTLIKKLNGIVLLFLQACYQAISTRDQLAAIKTYQTFVQNPYDKANYAFLQSLFAQLVEEKLTPGISAELFMAPESDRQIYTVQVIRQTAEKNPDRFNEVLEKTIRAQRETGGSNRQFQTTAKRSIFSILPSSLQAKPKKSAAEGATATAAAN